MHDDRPDARALTPDEVTAMLDEASLVYRSPVAIIRERLTSLRAKANHEAEQAALFHDMATRHEDAHRVAKAEADDLAALLERLEDEGAGVKG